MKVCLCLNPDCLCHNSENETFCQRCGSKLRLGDRYRVIRLIGQGGFGRTFKAVDEHCLNRFCVVKQLTFKSSDRETLALTKKLFKREAESLGKLGQENPHIAALYAFFEQDNQSYLIQEYIEGENLLEELYFKKYTEEDVQQFLEELLPVLDFIHSKKIIHRDIKPENILRRSKDNRLFLIDFGISKQLTKTIMMPRPTIVGTPGYAPYEQLRGVNPDPNMDLYALGATAIRLLTGCFPKQQNGSMIDGIYDTHYAQWTWREYLQRQGRDVSDEFAVILDKLIEYAPAKRYQSAQEALDDLNTLSNPSMGIQGLRPQVLRLKKVLSQPPKLLKSHNQSSPPITSLPTVLTSTSITSSPTVLTSTSITSSPTVLSKVKSTQKTQYSRRNVLKYIGYGGLGMTGLGLLSKLTPNYPTKGVTLEPFTFDTVKVNGDGNLIEQKTKQGQQFTVSLGNGVSLEMVKIKGGTFMMGSPETEEKREKDEPPPHQVSVSDFYMGKYEVTQEQWQRIMGNNPSHFQSGDTYPVETVSWHDCQKFCQKLSKEKGLGLGLTFSLPSETQWEYACCAGTSTPFYYGETLSTEIANYNSNYTYGRGRKGIYRGKTTEVGSFPANGFGLYDMHGNVWEFCQDNYVSNYENMPRDGTSYINESIKYIVLRGGSWFSYPWNCRAADRKNNALGSTDNKVGFRIVGVPMT
ncbi:MAG: SUMF1/EgtB/PvdO family nonheme iron enzyme [Microcystaceae cyanobacterium]